MNHEPKTKPGYFKKSFSKIKVILFVTDRRGRSSRLATAWTPYVQVPRRVKQRTGRRRVPEQCGGGGSACLDGRA